MQNCHHLVTCAELSSLHTHHWCARMHCHVLEPAPPRAPSFTTRIPSSLHLPPDWVREVSEVRQSSEVPDKAKVMVSILPSSVCGWDPPVGGSEGVL